MREHAQSGEPIFPLRRKLESELKRRIFHPGGNSPRSYDLASAWVRVASSCMYFSLLAEGCAGERMDAFLEHFEMRVTFSSFAFLSVA